MCKPYNLVTRNFIGRVDCAFPQFCKNEFYEVLVEKKLSAEFYAVRLNDSYDYV